MPINLTNGSFDTLLFAQKMAAQFNVCVILLNVVNLNIAAAPSVYDELCNESTMALRRIGRHFFGGDTEVNVSVRTGKPDDEIVAAARAEGCELIVLSTPKPSLWKRLMGLGTVKGVLRAAPCPTLVLPRVWKMCDNYLTSDARTSGRRLPSGETTRTQNDQPALFCVTLRSSGFHPARSVTLTSSESRCNAREALFA